MSTHRTARAQTDIRLWWREVESLTMVSGWLSATLAIIAQIGAGAGAVPVAIERALARRRQFRVGTTYGAVVCRRLRQIVHPDLEVRDPREFAEHLAAAWRQVPSMVIIVDELLVQETPSLKAFEVFAENALGKVTRGLHELVAKLAVPQRALAKLREDSDIPLMTYGFKGFPQPG